jgi:small GTP-binding protein
MHISVAFYVKINEGGVDKRIIMADEFDNFGEKLPPETQQFFRMVWDSLSSNERKDVVDIVTAFPSQTNMLRVLMKLSTKQFQQAFGKKHTVVIVGPANVGKSTLYNQLIHSQQDRAEVGPLPGTTRVNRLADAGIFSVVDTPGADAVGEVGEREQALALRAAGKADFLIITFDAIQGIKQTELDLFRQLREVQKPYIVVMNKMDLVKRAEKRVLEQAARNLGLSIDQVIPVSAKKGENLSQIVVAIAANEPQMIAALGQALPQYRWQLAWRSIVSAASISAVIALTPLPFLDFAPLVATQSMMVLSIARIYNYQITAQRARELIVTFGFAFIGRTLFHQLSKFAGLPGWILASAIATSTTVVMGYAASVWFERGERLSNEALSQMTKEMTKYLLESLKSFGKRKPGRKNLQETISQALENSPIAQDPSNFAEKAKSAPPIKDETDIASDDVPPTEYDPSI